MILYVYFFYFDPLLIPNATSETHDVAAMFQLHLVGLLIIDNPLL